MKRLETINFAGFARVFCATAVLLFMGNGSVNAQMADQAQLREINARNSISAPAVPTPFSLLDLSKVRWSHSYSLSYGSSSFGSGSAGLFTSAMIYDFSPSLSMALAVGVGHNPGALFDNNLNASANLFPAFSLDYHPENKKFRFNLTIAKSPGYNGYDRYGGFHNSSLFGSDPFSSRSILGDPYRTGVGSYSSPFGPLGR